MIVPEAAFSLEGEVRFFDKPVSFAKMAGFA
jgi:hypothetical protein